MMKGPTFSLTRPNDQIHYDGFTKNQPERSVYNPKTLRFPPRFLLRDLTFGHHAR